MELAGNSSQLNCWYHLEVYYTEEFLHDMSGFCIYIPSNQHPTHYWKLVITLFQECPENLIDYTESTSHIIQLTEPIINTEFHWHEYDIKIISLDYYYWINYYTYLNTSCFIFIMPTCQICLDEIKCLSKSVPCCKKKIS